MDPGAERTPDASPLISVVVPTFNEESDISRTLDSLLALRYPRKEILVVDDSTDRTFEILQGYSARGVRVCRGDGTGRSGARNHGLRAAKGEIVVILNADACPEPDFLDRILPHYRSGADFLVVENRVANTQHLLPRYLDALHRMKVDLPNYAWTEGFSCRREAALAVGLFPVDTPLPFCGGEDVIFGLRLRERFRKAADGSIVVRHYVAESLRDFWANRWGRGWGIPVFKFFELKVPLSHIIVVTAAKTILAFLSVALVLPNLVHAWRVSRFSSRGRGDLLAFWAASAVTKAAVAFGEWAGFFDVIRHRHWKSSRSASHEAPQPG